MSDVVRTLVNEIRTAEDYRLACMTVQHRIQTGQEVDWSLLHALAVKGHLLTLQQPESPEAHTLIASAFLAAFPLRLSGGEHGEPLTRGTLRATAAPVYESGDDDALNSDA